ncbi:alpha/beta fold hydrolase [Streptomyces polyrhachis]|uniref:Alpha/beta fold hydrolase n=1 Tax=Streptomyces polyrhachis TaxID=1282885 RepID=A0ABW2G792_9ACTN
MLKGSPMRAGRWTGAVVLALAAAGGCSPEEDTGAPRPRPAPVSAPAPAAERPLLTPAAPCPDLGPFHCATLNVPYDHSGARPGTLGLSVAMTDNADAPKGVLLFLAGGPGQPGLPIAGEVAGLLAPLLDDHRLVVLDQRGTGAGALRCELQDSVFGPGRPSATAVTRCAEAVGAVGRYYGTADTVADLELLRRALGAERWSIDAVSYGTYTAQRYALAHPRRVSRLVLDSVVPATAADPLDLIPLRAVPRVLRAACAARDCGYDPVADLRTALRRYGDGVRILDALTSAGADVHVPMAALHEAAAGHRAALDRLLGRGAPAPATVRPGRDGTPVDTVEAEEFSAALQLTTRCLDGGLAWGGSDTGRAQRERRLERAAARLTPADYGPFDAATVASAASTCLPWPRTPAPAAVPGGAELPKVPVLMLAGEYDLATPVEAMEAQRARTPHAETVVVPGGGHTVQLTEAGVREVLDFLGRD